MALLTQSFKPMNKLKQAIAYLVSKIQAAYYAARFFSRIFQEFPDGHNRVTHKGIRDRVLVSNTESPDRGVKTDGNAVTEAVRGSEKDSDTGMPCDEFLGFWAGDVSDRFYDPDHTEQRIIEGSSSTDLQDEAHLQQCVHKNSGWDLLAPRDRQAIVLDMMRYHQSRFNIHVLFTVRDVIEICDRADMHWDITFSDLWSLRAQDRIQIFDHYCDRDIKFYGLFWGLK